MESFSKGGPIEEHEKLVVIVSKVVFIVYLILTVHVLIQRLNSSWAAVASSTANKIWYHHCFAD